ncbi:MAG TPA: hypothetical protein VMT52_17190, partial [Planctomycetota bacterium]|nr:hypothetical protein [Planctomycetota bacterium]
MRNELTYRGESRYVSGIPLLEGAVLHIVGDQTFFVRGDSNMDGKIDITDAQSTLGYLFLTGIAPACLDALDSNDDGSINITDPITTLLVLFAGQGSMPPPYPSAGPDPTPDGLTCGE